MPHDEADLVERLNQFVHYMNYEKLPIDHYGLNCWEVLHGVKPDRKRFAVQMAEARLIRMEENRSMSCLKGFGCGNK